MSAHTPGPWRVVRGPVGDPITIADSGEYVTGPGLNTSGGVIAEVRRSFIRYRAGSPTEWARLEACDQPAEANARLIAAAPELLEAARHAAMEWRLHGQLTDSCRVLERAIAKAEGR